jgi:hypothetical protein
VIRVAGAPAVLVAATLLAAGCGGGKSSATTSSPPPTTTAPAADPGREAIEAFVAAARRGNTAAMWRMLSTTSRERLGPTLADFRGQGSGELRKRFGSFRDFKPIVSERVTSELGVVAIDDGRRVDAVALRLEGTAWKLELGGPLRIRLIGQPLLVQVAVAVEGPGGAGTAVMYVDGQTVNATVRPRPRAPRSMRTSSRRSIPAGTRSSSSPATGARQRQPPGPSGPGSGSERGLG